MIRPLIAAMLFLSPGPAGAGEATPAGGAARAVFAPARLERIASWYRARVDEGMLSGAVIAVAEDGEVAYQRAVGFQDRARTTAMSPDSIFWIASMTKPVTSVAAMTLVEDGRLDLDAPVSRYLAELKGMQVGVERTDPATGTVGIALEPQKREMTIRDLLRHTSGLVYAPQFIDSSIHRLYGAAVFERDRTLADFAASLAGLPLAHQPGEVWEYGWNDDLLARIVEVRSGESFDQFLDAHIFRPLRMVDTGFYVPREKLGRLVDPAEPQRAGPWDTAAPARPPRLFSGGGGLVSTASDYLRFCRMLLNGGELDGVRVLKLETVREMTRDALPAGIRFAQELVGPTAGSTWGLGFAIRTDAEASDVPGAVGSYGWTGLWGTCFWVDPSARLAAVLMIQVPPGRARPYVDAMRHLTYGALVVPARPPAAADGPARVSGSALAGYAGRYAFGASPSPLDRQASAFGGLGIEVAAADGVVRVSRVLDGDPADRAGVRAGDAVARIDGTPTREMTLRQAIDRMRGPAGTRVMLTVERGGGAAPVELSIERASILSRAVALDVQDRGGRLEVTSIGAWPVLDFDTGRPVAMEALSDDTFRTGEGTRVAFVRDASGTVTGAVLDPGPLEQRGVRFGDASP